MPLQYTNIQTLFLFLFVLVASYLLSKYAEKHPRRSKLNLFLIVTLLTLLLGLRSTSVGRDTAGYASDMQAFLLGNEKFLQYYEIGFRYIIKAILFLTNSIQCVFLTCAFITILLIVKRFWEMRDSIYFSVAIVSFVCIFYSSLFSGFRQWLAVALIFYGSRYIERKKMGAYVVTVAIASTIHLSAALAIVSLGMFLVFSHEYQQKPMKFFAYLFSILGLILIMLQGSYLISMTRYSFETYKTIQDIGFMIISRIVLWLLFLLNYKSRNRKIVVGKGAMTEMPHDIDSENLYFQQYFLYLIGCVLGGFFGSSISRLSWFFCPFECALFAKKNINKKHWTYILIRILTLFIAAYSFYCFAIRGTKWITPYTFFWH